MQAMFNGVGEAFDEYLPNCSLWLETEAQGRTLRLLLDCGFTAPFVLFANLGPAKVQDIIDLDMIWISHFHGDHFMGLPALLLRFWEQGRAKPLTIVGQQGIEELVKQAMDMAYSRVRGRFAFDLEFLEMHPGKSLSFAGLALDAAHSEHPQPNLSLRINDGTHSLFYSGDGRPTEATRALAKGADLAVHESFSLEQDTPGHGTVPGSIAFAREAGVGNLALVHLRRDVRHDRRDEVLKLLRDTRDMNVFLPEPGDTFTP